MQISRRMAVATLLASPAVLLPNVSEAAARKKTNHIVVYVTNMHCGACAKRIAAKLYGVPGIVKVSTNIKKNYAIITPQKNKRPSPKAMWEATVAAKLTPVKLVSPQGTYTKLPKK